MISTKLIGRVGAGALTLAMLAGVLMVGATDTQAQFGRRDDRVHWDKKRTSEYALVFAYDGAYNDAFRSRGYRANYKDQPGYRNDLTGWDSWMGYQSDYRKNYRKGYEMGFKDAQANRARKFDRRDVQRVRGTGPGGWSGNDRGGWENRRDDNRGRYNRNEVFRIAQNNGYRDGLRIGQQDRQRRRNYQLDRTREYRNGLAGFRSEYRDREAYRQGYRDGFRRGYDEGYRRGSTPVRRFPW